MSSIIVSILAAIVLFSLPTLIKFIVGFVRKLRLCQPGSSPQPLHFILIGLRPPMGTYLKEVFFQHGTVLGEEIRATSFASTTSRGRKSLEAEANRGDRLLRFSLFTRHFAEREERKVESFASIISWRDGILPPRPK